MNLSKVWAAIENIPKEISAEVKKIVTGAEALEKKIEPDIIIIYNDAVAAYKAAQAASPQITATIDALKTLIAELAVALADI